LSRGIKERKTSAPQRTIYFASLDKGGALSGAEARWVHHSPPGKINDLPGSIIHGIILHFIFYRYCFGVSVFRRRPAIVHILLLLAAYLPVLAGGGECISLCLKTDGSLTPDYCHHCGRENTHGFAHSGVKQVSLEGIHHRDICTDIPLASGSMIHSAPHNDREPAAVHASFSARDGIIDETWTVRNINGRSVSPLVYRYSSPPPSHPFLSSILLM
jgi:hypothetical protein